jgi:hypothetical protein
MTNTHRDRKYSVEELVAAAYLAAREVTHNHVLAAILVSKTLESWLLAAGRLDVVAGLETFSPTR